MLSKLSRRHLLQGTVRVHRVVVGQPARQLRYHGLGIAHILEGNIVSFNRLHKALGLLNGPRAFHWGGDRAHVDGSCKGTCLSVGEEADVVRDPLNRTRRGCITPNTPLDRSQHHVFDQSRINAFRGSHPANRLSVKAVEAKSHSDLLFVPEVSLKAVRAAAQIALINRHPTIMSPGVLTAPDTLGQQKLRPLYRSVATAAVHPRDLGLQSIVSYQPQRRKNHPLGTNPSKKKTGLQLDGHCCEVRLVDNWRMRRGKSFLPLCARLTP